ncbi:MAG: hypothetical protein AB2404_14275, partial [Planifilum fimeticola]
MHLTERPTSFYNNIEYSPVLTGKFPRNRLRGGEKGVFLLTGSVPVRISIFSEVNGVEDEDHE